MFEVLPTNECERVFVSPRCVTIDNGWLMMVSLLIECDENKRVLSINVAEDQDQWTTRIRSGTSQTPSVAPGRTYHRHAANKRKLEERGLLFPSIRCVQLMATCRKHLIHPLTMVWVWPNKVLYCRVTVILEENPCLIFQGCSDKLQSWFNEQIWIFVGFGFGSALTMVRFHKKWA